jgi:enamine deaminase RidA (YjgF/YER057c/UK114 family)
VGNIGQPIENQINGAFDHLARRLESIGLTLESVVKMDCLFRDAWNIPVMEKVIRERFAGKYPARKSIQTDFAHIGGQEGLHFQLDAGKQQIGRAGSGGILFHRHPDENIVICLNYSL